MNPIEHDRDASCFRTSFEGQEATLEYERVDGWMVITHTRVPQEVSGRGIASRLTRTAFEAAREEGLQVRPMCSYAAGWAERHPEYKSLLE
ncbi:GNAT family N-acetyltransferase [Lysobacter korlensis]|uniref:GNAT family N-acetyltransferase n=1 Tax=Lysobacter korlensis TaxID=553636 RepID=A0ABV6RLL5_9GAMM